jgi:oligoribonuclease NrnB/cAMP/cGMP phosphodiesterase (DHH superfamily)
MSNVHIFTHSDLDGVGAAIILRRAFENVPIVNVSTEYHHYDTIDKALLDFIKRKEYVETDLLIISDICPDLKTCEELDKANGKLIKIQLFDHHVTRSWICKKFKKWCTYNSVKCGTEMVAKAYKKNSQRNLNVSNFVETVGAWDLWRLKSKHRKRGEDLNLLVQFMGCDTFENTFFLNPIFDLTSEGKEIIKYLKDQKKRYVEKIIKGQVEKAKIRKDGAGNNYAIIFADNHISDVARAILDYYDKNEELGYVAIVNPIYNTVSLRSRGAVDVSIIAKKFGGGGHKGASGFQLKLLRNLDRSIYKRFQTLD